MRLLTILVTIFILNSCAYPIAPASRIGYTPDEHAKLKKQAEEGDLDAQLAYGWSYCCGEGALYSNRLATRWICSAAKKEHPDAQFKIAQLYNQYGFSLPGYEDSVKKLPANDRIALAWFIVAEKNGHKGALEGREMFRKMAFDDVVAAIDLSRKYPDIPCEIR